MCVFVCVCVCVCVQVYELYFANVLSMLMGCAHASHTANEIQLCDSEVIALHTFTEMNY